MAELAPFRGLRYDVERVSASSVLAPPYDVIDEGFRKQLAAKDSHNCVHIILPQGEGDAKYQHARDELESWQSQGILVRDARPAIYRYHQEYRSAELGEQLIVRRGFVAAVKLHAYDDGVILRHERTLKGPKIDRLKLWHATRCHLSQIFTLYSDPAGRVDALFAATETRPPDLDGTTDDGTRHVM